MTNQEAKQEAIKKAYGEHWDEVQKISNIDENGWTDSHSFPSEYVIAQTTLQRGEDPMDFSARPKSLIGIEDNNGWIRIEPDGSNLPDIHIDFIWLRKLDGETKDKFHINGHSKSDIIKGYTHYKPITPELKPIY